MQVMKRDWLKIAEYISLAGAVVGTIAAILLEAVIYGAVLLFLSLWLNLMIRYRWHQINQEQIIHTTIILENLLTDIRETIAERARQMKAEIAQFERSAENQASHEDIDHLIMAIEQVQGELCLLDDSVIPVKEQLETLITTFQNHSVSPQQFEHWQEKLADILTRVEARSLSSDALAEITKLHQEIEHWITELKQIQAIDPSYSESEQPIAEPQSQPADIKTSESELSAENLSAENLSAENLSAENLSASELSEEPSSDRDLSELSHLSESDRELAPELVTYQAESPAENLSASQTEQPSSDRELSASELLHLSESDQEFDQELDQEFDQELDQELDQEADLNSQSDRTDPNQRSESDRIPQPADSWGSGEIVTEPDPSPETSALTQRPINGEELSQLVPESGAFSGAFSHYPQPIWAGYESPESHALAFSGAFSQFSDPLTFVTTEPTPQVDLSHTNLSGVSLTGANLAGAILIQSNLSQTDLSGADLRGADLRGADLSGANLDQADLEAANLAGANLIHVNLRTADLTGANLSGANLSGQNLMGLNLANINLSGANLQGAILIGTNLSAAQLIAANLTGANLTEANLELANLSGANLTDAQIQQANFGTGDRQANLTDAIGLDRPADDQS